MAYFFLEILFLVEHNTACSSTLLLVDIPDILLLVDVLPLLWKVMLEPLLCLPGRLVRFDET
jgi:hypothetical protein